LGLGHTVHHFDMLSTDVPKLPFGTGVTNINKYKFTKQP